MPALADGGDNSPGDPKGCRMSWLLDQVTQPLPSDLASLLGAHF